MFTEEGPEAAPTQDNSIPSLLFRLKVGDGFETGSCGSISKRMLRKHLPTIGSNFFAAAGLGFPREASEDKGSCSQLLARGGGVVSKVLWHYIKSMFKTFIPAKEPSNARRVSEGSLKGSLKGVSERVSEGVSKGLEGVSRRTLQNALQNAFKNPLKTLQEGVKIDDAVGFPWLQKSVPGSWDPVAGNESLESM